MLKHKPYSKLKGILREKGLTAKHIAQSLGLSETSVYHKINGISDFYISEVKKLDSDYGISFKFFY